LPGKKINIDCYSGPGRTNSVALALFRGGIFFTVVVLLWPALMTASEITGSVEEQLRQITEAPGLYMANFFWASLIAPSIMVLMLTFARYTDIRKQIPLIYRLSLLFLAGYFVFVSISYVSQYAYLPRLLAEGNTDLAVAWYFGNESSRPYFFNQLGYSLFGIAAVLIGYKMLHEPLLPRLIGIVLWVSGLLCLLAFLGLILHIPAQGLISILSGLLTLPVGIMSILWGRKLLQGK
jgi:CDP-diacylglycerol--glycerol-3-phosphate 3-phosphatidyltransferase